jgi:hypothetical protein
MAILPRESRVLKSILLRIVGSLHSFRHGPTALVP